MQLNKKQKEATESLQGPVLVLAGAGSGKTRVLTYRIVEIIKKGLAEPHEVLAITFTNKAAKEMKERVSELLQSDKELNRPSTFYESKPFVSTFHSLGVHILKENARVLGIKRNFKILDRQDQKSIIKEVLKRMLIDPKGEDINYLISGISFNKNKSSSPDLLLANSESPKQEKLAHVWKLYEEEKKKMDAFDFDDLLLVPLELLQSDAKILEKYASFWKYIHVDEYQDTNKVQFEILKLLSFKHKNIFAVGDVDQVLYSWRGASTKHTLLFEKHFEGAKVIMLEQNYRSTKTIIGAANAVIEKNKNRFDKKLFTENEEGEPIEIFSTFYEKNEAFKITEKINELLASGYKKKDIAVLYRMNFISRVLEEAFLSEGIDYQLLGTKFFDRKEIKDFLAFVNLALNKDSFVDLHRALSAVPQGIGKASILKIQENKVSELGAAQQIKIKNFFEKLDKIKEALLSLKLSESFSFALDESGLRKRLEEKGQDGKERLANIFELIEVSKKYELHESPLEAFLESVALSQDQDEFEEEKDAVRLMTIHASKGLEFKVVFLPALEQGIFPADNFSDKRDEEEERRLFYVAITRAQERLFISHAFQRHFFGELSFQEPSEFLDDLPEEFTEKEELEEDRLRSKVDLIDW